MLLQESANRYAAKDNSPFLRSIVVENNDGKVDPLSEVLNQV